MNTQRISVLAIVLLIGFTACSGREEVIEARVRTRDDFNSTYSLARAAAVRYNRVARLHLDTTRHRFWVEVDTSAVGTLKADTIGVVKDLLAAEYGYARMAASIDTLYFDALGRAYTSTGCDPDTVIVTFSIRSRTDTLSFPVCSPSEESVQAGQ
jgi:hypothetical protein